MRAATGEAERKRKKRGREGNSVETGKGAGRTDYRIVLRARVGVVAFILRRNYSARKIIQSPSRRAGGGYRR